MLTLSALLICHFLHWLITSSNSDWYFDFPFLFFIYFLFIYFLVTPLIISLPSHASAHSHPLTCTCTCTYCSTLSSTKDFNNNSMFINIGISRSSGRDGSSMSRWVRAVACGPCPVSQLSCDALTLYSHSQHHHCCERFGAQLGLPRIGNSGCPQPLSYLPWLPLSFPNGGAWGPDMAWAL